MLNFSISFKKDSNLGLLSNSGHTLIGSLSITTRTNWEALDSMIKRLFSDYLAKLEQSWRDENELDQEVEEMRRHETNLGLDLDSIHMYYVGDKARQTPHTNSHYFLDNDQDSSENVSRELTMFLITEIN